MSFPDPVVHDKKYRDSFKKMRAHKCFLTGHEWQEFDSVGVTGCHITVGRNGWNIKDDSLILPLRQDLHMEMDRNQPEFLIRRFDDFPQDRLDAARDKVKKIDGRIELIEIIKQMARDYYEEFNTR